MRTFARFLAAAVPFGCALYCAAPYGYLDDSPAFAARALERPSTPAELFAFVLRVLPIGPLSFRTSVASALCLGAIGAVLFRAIYTLLGAQGVRSPGLRSAAALGLGWLAAGSTPLFARSAVPSATACTVLLVLLTSTELQALVLSPRRQSAERGGTVLGLSLGLLLAQAPSAFVLLGPAVAVALLAARAQLGFRFLVPLAAALSGGLLLLVRGAPGAGAPALALALSSSNLLAVLEWSPLWTASALLGAIAIAQTRGNQARSAALRRVGLAWSSTFLALAVLGSGPASSAVLAPIAALLTAALGGALSAPDGAGPATAVLRTRIAAAFVCALGAYQLHAVVRASDSAAFALPEAWAASSLDRAAPRALVLAHEPLRSGLALAARAETNARPDLRIVAVPALGEPSYARALAETTSLRPLVRSYLLQGELSRSELESLSVERPLLLDLPASPELHATLRPDHLWYEVAGTRVARSEAQTAADAYVAQLESLASEAGPAARTPAGRAFFASLDRDAARYFASHRDASHAEAARLRAAGARGRNLP